MNAPVIALDGMSRSHGRGQGAPLALDRVSLAIAAGETLALVGESGSGKSTLARALAGLLPRGRGEIRFDGTAVEPAVEARGAALRRSIQIVFQNPDRSLNPRHSVGTILGRPLRLFFGLKGAAAERRIGELLEGVRLPADYRHRYPAELSGGERQRVAIARALAAEPALLLCDEVISALDVSVQASILELLAAVKAKTGLAMLFITHDLAVVRWFADRVAVLYRGSLCEVGPVEDIYGRANHPYTALLLGAVPGTGGMTGPAPAARAAAPAAAGCPFAPRCPARIEGLCDRVAPPWRSLRPEHLVRCHLEADALAQPPRPEGAAFPAGRRP